MNDTSNTQTKSNRRLYIYLAITAILLLGACIGSYCYLKISANSVLDTISQIETDVLADDWQQAGEEYHNARHIWNSHKNFWQCFLIHQEIDDIERSFMQLQGFLETQDTAQSLSSLYELSYSIDHVPDTERISFYNIL